MAGNTSGKDAKPRVYRGSGALTNIAEGEILVNKHLKVSKQLRDA